MFYVKNIKCLIWNNLFNFSGSKKQIEDIIGKNFNKDIFNKQIFNSNLGLDVISGLKDGGASYASSIQKIADSFGDLDAKTLAVKATQEGLSETTIKNVMALKGYKQEAINAALSSEMYANAQKAANVQTKVGTVLIKAQTVAQKAWNAAKQIGKDLLISAAVTVVMYGLSKAAEAVFKKFEDASEAANGFITSIKNMNKEFSDSSKSISSLNDRYKDLSSGVDKMGNNISLTTSEYEEYKDIISQVSDMIPDLNAYYNDQGEKIGFVTEKLTDLNKAYDEYKQRTAMNFLANGNDEGQTVEDMIDQFNRTNVNDEQYMTNHFWNTISASAMAILGDNNGIKNLIGTKNALDELKGIRNYSVDELKDWLKKDSNKMLFGYGLFNSISDEDAENAKERIPLMIQQYEAEISSEMSNLRTILQTELESLDEYYDLDSEQVTILSGFISNLDNDTMEALGLLDESGQIIKNKLVSLSEDWISTIQDENISEAIKNIITLDPESFDGTLSELREYIDKYIEIIATAFNIDSDKLRKAFGTDEMDRDIAVKYDELSKKVKPDDVNKVIKMLSIEDLEIASKLEIPKYDLLSWDELLKKIKEFKAETKKVSKSGMIDSINELSDGFDKLDEIYADVYDGKSFDFSKLNTKKFEEAFGNLKDEYTAFIETIASSPNDLSKCQGAFDNLVHAFINKSEVFENLTPETEDVAASYLNLMGVSNAARITEARLAAQEEMNRDVYDELTLSSRDLNDATWEDINSVLALGQASETSAFYLNNLALSKIDFQNIDFSQEDTVNEICSIAEAAGGSKEYVDSLREALEALQKASKKGESLSELKDKRSYYNNKTFFTKEDYAEIERLDAAISAAEAGVSNVEDVVDKVIENISKNSPNAEDFYARYIGGKATQDAIDKANEAAKNNLKYYDLIEIAISKIQRTITNLGKTVSATYLTWGKRNNALLSEMSEVRSEISLQQKAYEHYMSIANSFGLSDYYKNLIMNGDMSIISTSDEDLQDQIDNFKEYYDKAIECQDAIQDLRDNLADLAKTRFDNISSEFDNIISQIEHSSDMIEGRISQVEEQGYIAGTVYYENLINTELENLDMLQRKYSSLNSLLNSGDIEVYSESWYEMKSAINDVEKAIQDSNTAVIQFKNNIRDLKWEVFDKTRDAVSDITDESDFLIDLLSNKNLFEDNGNLNNYGQSVVGLHAVKYNTYMRQSDDYAKEIARIDKELANDPYNDKLLERRQELVDAQRDMISAAEDEKQAIKDLISNSYDAMLDALQKIIDKRKEALQAEKDLYDYQKSVAEQSKTITSLEKQIVAYNGDDSEETRATIQQLKVSLEEARTQLAETEYEKWVSDQEQMMDTLYSQVEEWLNSRLDDLDSVIRESIEATNANAETISSTINAEANNVGIKLTEAMNNIWSGSDGLKPIVTEYIQTFKDTFTKVQQSIDAIAQKIQANIDEANRRAQEEANRKAQEEAARQAAAAQAQAPAPTTPTSQPSGNSGNSGSGSWGSWFVSKKDSYPKDKLNKDGSIVDRLKWKDIDSSKSARAGYYSAMGGSGTYTGSASQNTWMLQQMKAHGYRKGTKSATKGWHLTDEEGFGSEIIATKDGVLRKLDGGETIFNKDMVRNLWDLASGNIMNPIANIPTPNIVKNTDTSRNVSVDLGKIDINMYGVNDPVEFQEQLVQTMKNSTKVEKIIQDMTLGNALGANSLSKYRR